MQPDFQKDFQPEGGDPEGNPECRKDFQPEGGHPAGRRRFGPHALRAAGTVVNRCILVICIMVIHYQPTYNQTDRTLCPVYARVLHVCICFYIKVMYMYVIAGSFCCGIAWRSLKGQDFEHE